MSSAARRRLWPNIGAEEGDAARFATQPAVVATRSLWSALFDDPPAFALLEDARGLVPWLCDAEAAREAEREGLPLFGASPEVVARVHDKAFAVTLARDQGIEPVALRPCLRVFDPPELSPGEAFADRVREACLAWPAPFASGGYTLKPRLGTSGRGRVGGSAQAFDPAPVRGAAARLARRGGAILEPWLERVRDLSVVAWIAPPKASAEALPVTLLATLEQIVSASGLWLGHCGEIDRRGRIHAGTTWDEGMREAASLAAEAARRAGFSGPCGIDGFAYREARASDAGALEPAAPVVRLRPLVEINARFTLGHVCAGWLRRLHARVVAQSELEPGRRVGFLFALAPPASDDDWPARTRASGALRFDLHGPQATATAADAPGSGPFMLFHDDPDALRPLAERLRARAPAPR